MDLRDLLRTSFHHSEFRANQEAVCQAATEGRDVLLVMPTGAGKSLCYQLPALARGGTALVVSPLIALMEDQAAKLSALGLRVARIHSGLPRKDSQVACQDYVEGRLQFLFIAPERLRVPGFVERLARKKPSLIAIDEAHCISAWGHDFRPDYRTLGDHLPALRPSAVIALTATATPTVQRDIVTQLQLRDPALFIHGFRRDNLAIEVVEMSKPRRHSFVAEILQDPATRPAIVYAPSRKAAEELAAELNHAFHRQTAAAYHAGLDAATRERVQQAFQSGGIEVVVATIAFGMGIDKADVRTVIHTALPASVEAYYQEIGRAGRDGLPARTVLLHSYADRRMHEFFFERDYPPVTELDRVASVLPDEFAPPEQLARSLKMAPGDLQKSIEKLVAQGAAQLDVAGYVRRTGFVDRPDWRAGYQAQLAFRRAQLDRMAAFAETPQCRMAALIQHFGDTADGLRPCGHCDFCAPESMTAQSFGPPAEEQARQLRCVLASLASAPSRSIGKLHAELGLRVDRRSFDVLLEALVRAGYVALVSDSFTNSEGEVIAYKKATLTHEGRSPDAHKLVDVLLPVGASAASSPAGKRSRTKAKAVAGMEITLSPAQEQLQEKLRAWRKTEAAKNGKPAFLVLSDKVLRHLAAATPRSMSELLAVSGIGPEKADRYGAELVALCREDGAPSSVVSKAPLQKHESRPKRAEAKPASVAKAAAPKAETFHRPTRLPDEAIGLTPEQQVLDQRLRDWRKEASAQLGAPPFLVLGSGALRAIVLRRPRTADQLRSIDGVTAESARAHGPAILEICNG